MGVAEAISRAAINFPFDDVDGAARAVAAERRKGEGLADNALPGEGRVAMQY